MFWILQNNIYSEDGWERLVSTLDRMGVKYSTHKVVPFLGTLEPEADPPSGAVVVMGSYTLARAAKERGWSPGAFLNGNFDLEIQERYWLGCMFNNARWIGALKDVPEQAEPFFIRPTADSKAFSGYVTDWPDFKVWLEREQRQSKLFPQDGGAYFSEDTRVLVSRKKDIAREYRTWVVDGKVVTSSLYKQGPHKYARPLVDERVVAFAQARANEFQPDRAFVLDVWEDFDGELWIGEVNNLNSAGFYEADTQKLVAAIEAMEY